jgi:hypothetical protein
LLINIYLSYFISDMGHFNIHGGLIAGDPKDLRETLILFNN